MAASSSSSSSTPTTPLAILCPPVSSATKLVPPSSLFLLRNPEPKFSALVAARPIQSPLSTSRREPPRALVGFSPAAEEADPEPAPLTLRRICSGRVHEDVLRRQVRIPSSEIVTLEREVRDVVLPMMEEVGYVLATDVQREAFPALFSGRDCVLHAQTGSGKTLTYLLRIFSVMNTVAKVARLLAAKPMNPEMEQDKSCTVMALLDGGTLKRHRSWLKAEPPAIVVATIRSSCQMLEKQKWTKGDVVHVHVNPIQPMPSCLDHRFVTCHRSWRHQTLLHLIQWDSPESGIIFIGEQSEKSKKAGNVPPTTLLLEFLKNSYGSCSNILLLEEDMNFNARAATLSVSAFHFFHHDVSSLTLRMLRVEIWHIKDMPFNCVCPIINLE
ncbi:hypothetical protein EUGRSUZ_H03567 [Eucalyptus grandis]|uniref:Uncharacterized protein n=2 Tax=Eucalyptus grandis TaxID=71139 RepID=A0ACC3JU47_EUCGR|nr:hypothetical protein EUGRSUZ_H03567 [Eucalyptus grandis]